MTQEANKKIIKVRKLLEFVLTLDDLEITKSVIESVVEVLSEIAVEENISEK